MSNCDKCKSIVKQAIDSMPADLTCGVAVAGIAAAIDAAGGGPEDPIADALVMVAAGVIEENCVKYGWPWIKSHAGDIASAMCKEAKFC